MCGWQVFGGSRSITGKFVHSVCGRHLFIRSRSLRLLSVYGLSVWYHVSSGKHRRKRLPQHVSSWVHRPAWRLHSLRHRNLQVFSRSIHLFILLLLLHLYYYYYYYFFFFFYYYFYYYLQVFSRSTHLCAMR